VREIIQYPDPMLRQTSKPVEKIDDKVKEIAVELIHHINALNYVGLSAVQLGELIRMFVAKRVDEDIIIINPEVIKLSKQTYTILEGCTSIDHGRTSYLVARHKSVKITGTDLDGRRVTYKAWGLFGEVLQHENDHLDGKLILDHGKGA